VFSAISRWSKDNPRIVFLVVVGVTLLGIFLAVITPLFATSGPPMAVLGGSLPPSAISGKDLEIDVAIDNIGDPVINQVCVGALVQGNLTPKNVIFQNIDNEPFVNGTACGGMLSSQESISAQVFFSTGSPGTVQLVLSPMAGKQVIGAALSGSLSLLSP
jgi:hypothetical protein